jgi:hypothetical protein
MQNNCIKIRFNIINEFFILDCLIVWVDWKFPFLPRIGDSVGAWIWIESEQFDLSKVEEKLTPEGISDLKFRGGDIESWLYDVGCESGFVSLVSFSKEYNDDEIVVDIYLGKENVTNSKNN